MAGRRRLCWLVGLLGVVGCAHGRQPLFPSDFGAGPDVDRRPAIRLGRPQVDDPDQVEPLPAPRTLGEASRTPGLP